MHTHSEPVLYPEPEAINALGRAVARGVDVRVMMPSTGGSDNPMVQHAGHRNFEKLLRCGVRLFEYALASHLHVSGPLAMVVCGLMIGNGGRALAMSDDTRRYIDMFWELLDEILNAVLFVLIGLEVLVIAFTAPVLVAGAVAIVVTLASRWLTVGLPVGVARSLFKLPQGSSRVLAWGGLRGGISVALALSLPLGADREIILALIATLPTPRSQFSASIS